MSMFFDVSVNTECLIWVLRRNMTEYFLMILAISSALFTIGCILGLCCYCYALSSSYLREEEERQNAFVEMDVLR